eukprot:413987-Lingulodinium_polyedra.AAC.1
MRCRVFRARSERPFAHWRRVCRAGVLRHFTAASSGSAAFSSTRGHVGNQRGRRRRRPPAAP